MSLATGRHAYDEPSGTQPRVLHGARWALNASPGWTQVGISRVRGIAAARSCKADGVSFTHCHAEQAQGDDQTHCESFLWCHFSSRPHPPVLSGGGSMVSVAAWWGDACILGLAWSRYRNADGVSFTHCCAKQVPCDYRACVCLSYYAVAW